MRPYDWNDDPEVADPHAEMLVTLAVVAGIIAACGIALALARLLGVTVL